MSPHQVALCIADGPRPDRATCSSRAFSLCFFILTHIADRCPSSPLHSSFPACDLHAGWPLARCRCLRAFENRPHPLGCLCHHHTCVSGGPAALARRRPVLVPSAVHSRLAFTPINRHFASQALAHCKYWQPTSEEQERGQASCSVQLRCWLGRQRPALLSQHRSPRVGEGCGHPHRRLPAARSPHLQLSTMQEERRVAASRSRAALRALQRCQRCRLSPRAHLPIPGIPQDGGPQPAGAVQAQLVLAALQGGLARATASRAVTGVGGPK